MGLFILLHPSTLGPGAGAMTHTVRRASFGTAVADIILHPSLMKLEGRLSEITAVRDQAQTGLTHLLERPDYLASTIRNARRSAVSIDEMHRRGVANLLSILDAEEADIRRVLDGPPPTINAISS